MNKMWIRLSVAFSLIMLIAAFLPVLGLVIISSQTVTSYQVVRPEGVPIVPYEGMPGNIPPLSVVKIGGGIFPLEQLLFFLASVSLVIGTAAGLWVSRSISKPATRLVTAVQAISKQNLSYRVPKEGSQELVDLARAVNQMADDLESAEQLRRNMLADVTHELRTPLTVIQGNLRAMLDGIYPVSEDEIRSLYRQTEHLGRLFDDLHLLALAEAGQLPMDLQPTQLAAIASEVISLFEPIAREKNLQLISQLDAAPPVDIDPKRFRQILHNLLSNAIRHTPEGGFVTVMLTPAGEGICVSVADTGEGIHPEVMPHIFERVYHRDHYRSRDTGGSGLGLAIIKAIVTAHRGRIEVQSEGIGKGSTFLIYLNLPASQNPVVQ